MAQILTKLTVIQYVLVHISCTEIFFQSDKNVRKKNKENFHFGLEVKYGFHYHDFHKTHNAQESNSIYIGKKKNLQVLTVKKIWQVLTETYLSPEVTCE